jgi:hypothetical protein
MAIRIKSSWHESDRNKPTSKTLEDNAGALAFIAWRLSLESAKKLHREGFDYRSDKERVGVISEFLAFQIQLADRLAFDRLGDEDREAFINALGQRLADYMQENMEDIVGPGNYRPPFIAMLNERLGDYSGLSFENGEPGFDFVRYFGDRILKVMGENQTNRWVFDQITQIEAPEIAEKLKSSLGNLFG